MKGNLFIKLNLWLQPHHLGSPMALFQISAYKHFEILKDPSIPGNLCFLTLYTRLVKDNIVQGYEYWLWNLRNLGWGSSLILPVNLAISC